MAIPPAPMKLTCSACGRSDVFAPKSDAIFLDEFKSECKWCGHKPLVVSMLSRSSVWLARLGRKLSR